MRYDIVIVGGGMAGLAFAARLAQNTSLSIGIIESTSETKPLTQSSSHHRVSAITLSSQALLKKMEIWQQLATTDISPFKAIQIGDRHQAALLHFDATEVNRSTLGFILENHRLIDALKEKIKSYPRITYHANALPDDFNQAEGTLTLADGRLFKADLFVAADGARSWLRDRAELEVNPVPYHQHALVATIRTELSHEKMARQIFHPEGPLALLPLFDAHHTSIVWSLSDKSAQHFLQCDETTFNQALMKHAEHQLGEMTVMSDRHLFPLHHYHAKTYLAERVVLIGDAAHVVHPLAGQGLNMGLFDAFYLAEVIKEAHHKNRDFSLPLYLKRYERRSQAEHDVMQKGIDAIHFLFAREERLIKQLRSSGLQALQHLPFIKQFFMRMAGC